LENEITICLRIWTPMNLSFCRNHAGHSFY
jgi:hypothetical protein